MTEWKEIVHELCTKFGLAVEHRGQEIIGRYWCYYVIGSGYKCLVVYNTKISSYEQTQDIKYAEECIEAYISIIKKWKVHFRNLLLESDFK